MRHNAYNLARAAIVRARGRPPRHAEQRRGLGGNAAVAVIERLAQLPRVETGVVFQRSGDLALAQRHGVVGGGGKVEGCGAGSVWGERGEHACDAAFAGVQRGGCERGGAGGEAGEGGEWRPWGGGAGGWVGAGVLLLCFLFPLCGRGGLERAALFLGASFAGFLHFGGERGGAAGLEQAASLEGFSAFTEDGLAHFAQFAAELVAELFDLCALGFPPDPALVVDVAVIGIAAGAVVKEVTLAFYSAAEGDVALGEALTTVARCVGLVGGVVGTVLRDRGGEKGRRSAVGIDIH